MSELYQWFLNVEWPAGEDAMRDLKALYDEQCGYTAVYEAQAAGLWRIH